MDREASVPLRTRAPAHTHARTQGTTRTQGSVLAERASMGAKERDGVGVRGKHRQRERERERGREGEGERERPACRQTSKQASPTACERQRGGAAPGEARVHRRDPLAQPPRHARQLQRPTPRVMCTDNTLQARRDMPRGCRAAALRARRRAGPGRGGARRAGPGGGGHLVHGGVGLNGEELRHRDGPGPGDAAHVVAHEVHDLRVL